MQNQITINAEFIIDIHIGYIFSIINSSSTVFPNPADQYVKFDLTNHHPGKENLIVIMDQMGKVVDKIEIGKSDRYAVWNTMSCATGLYYYQITGSNSSETGKIIIMK